MRHAVRTALSDLTGGELVLVGCSGGADSLALAAACAFEAPRAGLRAGAVTVDHGLQPGSADRAAALAGRLTKLGLAPVEVAVVTVGSAGGPEAAARAARYAALNAAADRLDAVAVLLGHTRDDQAETVLLGLARGSGPRSLAGMAPVSADGRYRRPLLGVDRATTAAACAAEGLPVWDDPHNCDPAFTRVRVRRDVLPALTRALGPGVPEALARTADLLRQDAAALDEWAARAAASAAEAAGPDRGLAVDRLAELPTAVRRRVLRSAAIAAGCPPGELFAVHVEAVDALVVDWHGQLGIDLPAGITARRHYGRLCFDQGQRQ